jgi:hypothetical protein
MFSLLNARQSQRHISAPKRLPVVEHKERKNLYYMKSLFGAERRVDECQRFHLLSIDSTPRTTLAQGLKQTFSKTVNPCTK